jgi:molecular chaperone DnaK (HSP70)
MHLRESVTGAVVTVPAHFDHRQRGATLEAVNSAGVPTAFASRTRRSCVSVWD